jgi:hypothetical protein
MQGQNEKGTVHHRAFSIRGVHFGPPGNALENVIPSIFAGFPESLSVRTKVKKWLTLTYHLVRSPNAKVVIIVLFFIYILQVPGNEVRHQLVEVHPGGTTYPVGLVGVVK